MRRPMSPYAGGGTMRSSRARGLWSNADREYPGEALPSTGEAVGSAYIDSFATKRLEVGA
jgi:hypothetical protein